MSRPEPSPPTGGSPAESALRLAHLAAIVASSQDAIISKTLDGRITTWNPAAEQLFGYTAAEAVGQPIALIIPPERAAEEAQILATIRRGERVDHFDTQRRRKDGALVAVSLSISPIRAADGRIVGASKILRDIRDRQRASQALRDSEARLAAMIDTAMDAIITVDADERIRLFNRAAEQIFGYPTAAMLGQPLSQLLPEALRDAHHAHLRSFGATGVTTRAMGALQPLSGRRANGTTFPLEAAISQIEAAGQKLYTVILRDITERQRAGDRNAYQARLLAAVNDAIVATDERLTITFWNAAAEAQYGWTAAEALGQNSRDLLHSEYPGQSRDDMRRQLEADGNWRGEATQLRRDGRRFPVDVNTIVLRDGGKRVNGYFSINRDITARKAAEAALAQQTEALRRSNADLEQFAYVASHDLQEPLRMVASYVQLLARRYQGRLDADADEFIQYAVDGAARMQQLINDLLAFSRVGTRGQPLTPAPAEAALAAALANLRLTIEESGALVTHTPLPAVLADPGQLTQLFQNLIANALKFHGPQPPRIEIGAAAQGGAWLFHVRDNGLGLDPQYAERIFVIFQRLHTRAEYPGTGIGLAICKKIVERCGGRLWVESQPGQGATFFFTLPGTGEVRDERQPAR